MSLQIATYLVKYINRIAHRRDVHRVMVNCPQDNGVVHGINGRIKSSSRPGCFFVLSLDFGR
ncbi:hypothetical protein [Methanosarcina sp. Kolksee]|uniref:hypothetical protein n=1 Tax=Methanosarcina sp. Kolksee TaxID=1434099 RepID=UPI000AC3C8F9|nr:hypothetical protein [Methanosarcina sp. Kolksee]